MANQMMQPSPQAPAAPPPGTGFAGSGQGYGQQPPQAPPPAAPPQAAAEAAPAAEATIDCPQCHSAVRAGSKFCAECGTPMAKHCTNCNADLSATAKFCAECGTPVNPPA
jgi:membrane protease subunit (stomatin/prohibitin family)